MFAVSLAELACVRRWWWSVHALTQMLSLPAHAIRPRVGPMSSGWLRQHESEFEKHGRGPA
jgi:hypothetical protein